MRLLPFLLLLLPATAAAQSETPSEALAIAERAYLYGDYPKVIERLTPLVQPTIKLADPDDLARAYELLGLSHAFIDKKEDARPYLVQLAKLRPDYEFDPVLIPPEVVTYYEQIRAEIADELATQREAIRKQREAEERERREANKIVEQRRRNSLLVAAMPLGIGQFQNEDYILGATFLSTELLAIGLSAGFFFAVEGLRNENGRFAPGDVDRAQSLQQAQLISGGVALGLMAVGIVHALITFEESVVIEVIRPNGGARPTPSPAENGLLRWTF